MVSGGLGNGLFSWPFMAVMWRGGGSGGGLRIRRSVDVVSNYISPYGSHKTKS